MKLVGGITGTSGIQYGWALVRLLEATDVESHIIVSNSAWYVMDADPATIEPTRTRAQSTGTIGACIASGSFAFDGMIVCPCSMNTLGYVANGIAEGLIPRIANVCLKEGRDLLVVPREPPMAHTHLENMVRLSRAGAIVVPACLRFYTNLESIDELVETFVTKLLDRLGIETPEMECWDGV